MFLSQGMNGSTEFDCQLTRQTRLAWKPSQYTHGSSSSVFKRQTELFHPVFSYKNSNLIIAIWKFLSLQYIFTHRVVLHSNPILCTVSKSVSTIKVTRLNLSLTQLLQSCITLKLANRYKSCINILGFICLAAWLMVVIHAIHCSRRYHLRIHCHLLLLIFKRKKLTAFFAQN